MHFLFYCEFPIGSFQIVRFLAYLIKSMAALSDPLNCVYLGIFGYLTIILGGKELIARSVSIPI